MHRLIISLLAILSFQGVAWAADPDEVLADPVLEARAKEVGLALRCVVCKSQSIEDSNAPLARDLRLLVRERIIAGDTNTEVLDFVSARYGDYVLLKPPVQPNTWLLWATPLLLLAVGGGVGIVFLRSQRAVPGPIAPLTAEEEAALVARERSPTDGAV